MPKMVLAVLAWLLIGCDFGIVSGVAQDYPSQTIHIITPFPPGSGPDVMIRMMAEHLSQTLKQSVVVEPRTGGSGIPAMEAIKRSPPDGHTLGLVSDQTLAIVPSLNAATPYDPLADFTPIARLVASTYFVLVAGQGPYRGLRDLIADARLAPDKVSYGAQAVGSQAHIGAAHFASLIGAKMLFVPNRNMSQLFVSIVKGEVSFILSTTASAAAFLPDGRIKPIAVASKVRSKEMPDVPTVAEAGGPPFESTPWLALVGPQGLPAEIVDRVHQAIGAALADPKISAWLRKVSFDPRFGGPDELRAAIAADLHKNAELIKRLGIATP